MPETKIFRGNAPLTSRMHGARRGARGGHHPDGRYLLAASGNGAVVIRGSRAEHGRAGGVLGMLASPGGAGAVEVALSRDGRLAFVTRNGSGTLAVFNLAEALASGLRGPGFIGDARLGVNRPGSPRASPTVGGRNCVTAGIIRFPESWITRSWPGKIGAGTVRRGLAAAASAPATRTVMP
jgi:hypothetical protein